MEKELEVQIGMKQEMELSMKMLEKDICEKQDALVELRAQLDDMRAINQQLSHKSQVRLHFCILFVVPLYKISFSWNVVTFTQNITTSLQKSRFTFTMVALKYPVAFF